MANSTSGKVLYFDTTTGASVSGRQQIIGVFWASDEGANKDIAADDDFLLTDSKGYRIIGKRAKFAGDDLGVTPCRPLIVDGIIVSALDGGVCYVWIA